MANSENPFAQFGYADDLEDPTQAPTPEPAAPEANPFAQFDEQRGEENPFAAFGYAEDEPVAAPPEEVDDPGLLDQFVAGYYDSKGRSALNEAVNIAKEINTLRNEDEPLAPEEGPTGMLGVSGRDITRFAKTVTPEGRVKYADERMQDLADTLDKARKARERGEEVPFSDETQQFLDENSENTILEDFWNAPFTIIAELGVRSGYASLKGVGGGIVGGLAGSAAGPGGSAAGFATGMGTMSAREEYAASVMQGLQEAGVDLNDPEAIVAAVADEELIEEIQKKAATRAAIIGGVDAVTGGIAGKQLVPRQVKGRIARELVNQGAQMGVQTTGGATGEALAQLTTEGEIKPREVAAEAAGELVTAPIDVAGAVVAGARARGETDQAPDTQTMLDAIEAKQAEAETLAARQGGDNLEQALAGADAAAAVAQQIQAELQAAQAEQAEIDQAAEEQAAAKEQAFEQAEAEAAAQKEAEVREAEYQQELERGKPVEAVEEAGVEERPATATLAEAGLAAVKAEMETKKAKAAKKVEAKKKAVKKVEAVKQRELDVPKLEDKRPIVVSAEGTAITPLQMDRQIRQQALLRGKEAQMELFGPDAQPTTAAKKPKPIPVKVNEFDIEIENPKGTVRSGKRADGSTWTAKIKTHYGRIKGVRGADGDSMDVFLGSQNPTSQKVWVIDQIDQATGAFDEHKVMMGFNTQAAAVKAYKQNYETGWQVGPVTEMTTDQLRDWTGSAGMKSRPVSEEIAPFLGGMEDIQALQERATRKGRRRPKVMFKRGDAQVTVRHEPRPDWMSEEVPEEAIIFDAQKGADVVGNMALMRRGEQLQVVRAWVDESQRGEGLGQDMILEAVKYADQNGMTLVSDTSVTVAQLRAYEALRRKGELIVEYEDPAAVQAALENEKPEFSVMLERPVIRRMFTPEFAEDIQFARRDAAALPGAVDVEELTESVELALRYMPGLGTLGEDIVILESPAQAPIEAAEEFRQANAMTAKGAHWVGENFWEPGTAYIFTDNIESVEEGMSVLLHEAVAHKGLRAVLGAELEPLLQDVYDNGNQKRIGQIAEAYGLDLDVREDRLLAAEEYVANLAETIPQTNLLRRVIDAIRVVLREAGLLKTWTDNDILALLRDVRSAMRFKPLDKITLVSEAEIEETGEVVTIEQSADVALRQHDKLTGVLQTLRDCVG